MSISKDRIRAEVQNLGFSLVGFTTPEPLQGYKVFENWVSNKQFGEMTYLARANTLAKRADPRRLMPAANSIIVLAAAYPAPLSNLGIEEVQIAAYARFEKDYHIIFKQACQNVMVAISQIAGKVESDKAQFQAYVDTAPILEKELAQRAGLGWIGKNGCLINPKYGSWLLLAEIFTTLEIEPDLPFSQDNCGRCSRCVNSCPTSCIQPERTLNATQCIAYLTIEHRSDISAELCHLMDNHIFGCDICQIVCPWNQKATSDPNSILQASNSPVCSDELQTFLKMDEPIFHDRFIHTPIERTGWESWLRNCLIAAGNSCNEGLIPTLTDLLLSHPSALVRRHAVWAISQYTPETSIPILQQAGEHENEETVLQCLHTILTTK